MPEIPQWMRDLAIKLRLARPVLAGGMTEDSLFSVIDAAQEHDAALRALIRKCAWPKEISKTRADEIADRVRQFLISEMRDNA